MHDDDTTQGHARTPALKGDCVELKEYAREWKVAESDAKGHFLKNDIYVIGDGGKKSPRYEFTAKWPMTDRDAWKKNPGPHPMSEISWGKCTALCMSVAMEGHKEPDGKPTKEVHYFAFIVTADKNNNYRCDIETSTSRCPQPSDLKVTHAGTAHSHPKN